MVQRRQGVRVHYSRRRHGGDFRTPNGAQGGWVPLASRGAWMAREARDCDVSHWERVMTDCYRRLVLSRARRMRRLSTKSTRRTTSQRRSTSRDPRARTCLAPFDVADVARLPRSLTRRIRKKTKSDPSGSTLTLHSCVSLAGFR
jgi:hypothetical protein